jgi:hypothetical protein
LRELGKGGIDLSIGAGVKDFGVKSQARGADLKVLDKGISQHRGRMASWLKQKPVRASSRR